MSLTGEEITDLFNKRYLNNNNTEKEAFDACINLLISLIDDYGTVKWVDDNVVEVTTGGWSDNEDLMHSIIGVLTNKFSHKHYYGYSRGGGYWFIRDTEKYYTLIEKNHKDNYDKLRAYIQNKIDEYNEMYKNAVKAGMPTGGIDGEIDLLEEIELKIKELDDE